MKDELFGGTNNGDFPNVPDNEVEPEDEYVGLSNFSQSGEDHGTVVKNEDNGGDYKDEVISQLQEEISFLRDELEIQKSLPDQDDQLSTCRSEKIKLQAVSEDRRLRLNSLLAKNKRLIEKYHTCHTEKGEIVIDSH